ncbi:UNVERIFIED_CONTAM: hypothetical protein RMT77_018258 [Armadillidium vulgare]
MEYRFKQKYNQIDRKKMVNQKQAILNYNKERKIEGNKKKKATLPTNEDLIKIKEHAREIMETELQITPEIIQMIQENRGELYQGNRKKKEQAIKTNKNRKRNEERNEVKEKYSTCNSPPSEKDEEDGEETETVSEVRVWITEKPEDELMEPGNDESSVSELNDSTQESLNMEQNDRDESREN